MSFKSETIKSVFCNYLGYLFHALISLIATPIIVHTLGNAQYGIWSIVMSLTGYYGLMNFGIHSALIKYVAEYRARGDDTEINRLINSALVIFVGMSVIILCISYLFGLFFDRIFVSENISGRVIFIVILLTGSTVAINFLFEPFDSVLVAFNRFDLSNMIGVVAAILRTTSIILGLKLGWGLIGMSAIVLTVTVMRCFANLLFCRSIFPRLIVKPSLVNRRSMRNLCGFGFFNFMRHFSKLVMERAAAIIIGILLGISWVAIYSIAEGLIHYVWLFVKGIARVVMPLSSSLYAENELNKIRGLVLTISKYTFAVGIFTFMQFYLLGDSFMSLWMGRGYHEAYVVFCVLMISMLGMMTNEISIESVSGIGKNKFVGYVALAEAISNIVLSLYLAKMWGLVGVALGTVIPLTVTRAFIIPVYCSRLLGIRMNVYIRHIIVPPLVCSLPCLLFTFTASRIITPDSYLKLFGNVLLAGVIYCLLLYRYLEPELRSILQNRMRLRSLFLRRSCPIGHQE